MIPLSSKDLKKISKFLKKYDRKSTISQLAGLLTDPKLQANSLRIETLIHLAVLHCDGKRKPGVAEIKNWINRQLGKTYIAHNEDPAEDVFVTNIQTHEGNRLIYEGLWELSDYYLQIAWDTICLENAPQNCQELIKNSLSLLNISNAVAGRLNQSRWVVEPSTPKNNIRLAPSTRIGLRANAIIFTREDIAKLKLNRKDLEPFIFKDEDKKLLTEESVGNSSLEKKPIVDCNGELILALPNAVSVAIRMNILQAMKSTKYLNAYEFVVGSYQADQIYRDGLVEFNSKQFVSIPEPDDKHLPLHTWLIEYDKNHYLHLVLLHDQLEDLEIEGLASATKYTDSFLKKIESYVFKVAKACLEKQNYMSGRTVFITGGLGRGFNIGFNNWPSNWGFSMIKMPDFLMLSSELDRPLYRYMKFLNQKEWAESKGLTIRAMNGDYNIYCYWQRNNHQIVPKELAAEESSMLSIGNDYLLPIRKEIRKITDKHKVEKTTGVYTSVIRHGVDAYFKSTKNRSIYVSTDDVRFGMLSGAVETQRGASWLVLLGRKDNPEVQSILFELWSGLIELFDKLVIEFEKIHEIDSLSPIEIRLDFSSLIASDEPVDIEQCSDIEKINIEDTNNDSLAAITFPSNFLDYFQVEENTGEKLLLKTISEALIGLYKRKGVEISASADDLVDLIIKSSGARLIHLFRTYYAVDYILSQKIKPNFLSVEDYNFNKLKLGLKHDKTKAHAPIRTKQECNEFLHAAVDEIYFEIKKSLKTLNRASTLNKLIGMHEAIIFDRFHWKRTAKALLSLYESDDSVHDVAQEREQDRSTISLSIRTIIEISLCECPEVGGMGISSLESDRLLALATLLVETAMDSDAIHGDMAKPIINFFPNGEHEVDREYMNTIIKPFASTLMKENFISAASNYSKYYNDKPTGDRTKISDVYSTDFIESFNAEFGLSLDEAFDGFAECMEIAVDKNNRIVEISLKELKNRLIYKRKLSSKSTESFINAFGLYHRASWESPPSGYDFKDIAPWRFRRPLSFTAKPILILGVDDDDLVIYGIGTLQQSFSYVIGRSENGKLPQEFFSSIEMKKYIGKVNSIRGHEFGFSVAEELSNSGWKTRNEVQMTELGAPSELGDIDVLAWNSSGKVFIIECKRLQLSKTVVEVSEICKRFKGDANDELDKHIKRVVWIKKNPQSLKNIIGFVPDKNKLHDRLVTNTHVPMMYLSSLPISSDKIGPLHMQNIL